MSRSLRRPLQQLAGVLRAVGLLLLAGGLLLGCGRGSFIGRQYDDFTAYYNTFHNAQKVFEKGLESVNRSGIEIDRTRYISVFPDIQGTSGESSFEKAIQKSADVLREHPNSKWVDDALLLIGRSRYYQQSYVGAAQKFREVIALDGEREGEARFWLVRTLVAADRYAEAEEALRAGLEQEEDYGNWTARMRLARGQLLVRQEKWTEAEQALAQGLKGSLPDDLMARGAFLLGQVRETLENFDEAQTAYRQAAEHSPTYQLEFGARLRAAEMQGLSGDPETALERLESLERGDDTNEMRGKIARVRAVNYRELGRPEKAEQVLTSVLWGKEAPSGAVQGRLHYDLATLYRDTYEDFTQAAAHFDTAATTLSAGSRRGRSDTDQPARMLPRAPSDAAAQAERFRRLADRSQAVARMDSLLRLGRMPPSEFQSVVERIRKKRLKKQEQEQQARTNERRERQFRQRSQAGTRRSQSSPSQGSAVQTRGSDAGFLFHRDPTLVQQGRTQFRQTWGDRPLVDNWRRTSDIQDVSASSGEGGGAQQGQSSSAQGSAESVVDLSAVPRDSASQATMEKNRAVARYELGKALFRATSRPDSAETWFLLVLSEDNEHPVARKALYGLAQAHRAQDDTTAARKAYRHLIKEYPGTPYAFRAREQLGLERAQPVSGSAAKKADSVYARAYETWQNGAPTTALEMFLSVAETYPETPTVPRALLAAGVVYHQSARRDTTGRVQAQFQRFVDSLAQSNDGPPAGSRASADTTREAPPVAPPRERPPPDTMDDQDAPQRAADTIAAPNTRERAPRGPERRPDTADVVPDSSELPASDLSPREARALPGRAADSTTRAKQERRPRWPDSATTEPSASSPDTTAPSRQARGSDRAKAVVNAKPDSARADSGRAEQKDPLEVLLTHLTEQHSDTPEAKRAQKLLAHLERKRASPDSPVPDSSASRAEARSDSTVTPTAPDATRSKDEPAGRNGRQPVRASNGDRGNTAAQDTSSSGDLWSIVVASQDTRTLAQEVAAKYEDRFDTVEIVSSTVNDTTRYRVTVGRYVSSRAAEKALNARESGLPNNAWVLERR